MEKLYKTDVNLPNDFVRSPTVAVFTIDKAKAMLIAQLAGLVIQHELSQVEKINYGASFYVNDPDEVGTEGDNQVSTDVVYLNVSATQFWFSALFHQSEGEAWTEEQSISELLAHFGLSIPKPSSV